MVNLVYESELNAVLENLIRDAQEQLAFFCPYFKLHDRLKDCLKLRKADPRLYIIIVFGKNEEDPTKSLSKEDFEFLKSFPNIAIAYEKRLHAKYYANEKYGLITSLNLHTYSQNNNIEVGVYFETKNFLNTALSSLVSDNKDIATQAAELFTNIFKNASIVFENEPQFESKLLGFQKKYAGSKVLTDNSNDFFNNYTKANYGNENSGNYYKGRNTTQNTSIKYNQQQNGYCIRTGVPIPFNPTKPLSREAYITWAEFGNPDYIEKYCHSCGKPSKTSLRIPLCNECGVE